MVVMSSCGLCSQRVAYGKSKVRARCAEKNAKLCCKFGTRLRRFARNDVAKPSLSLPKAVGDKLISARLDRAEMPLSNADIPSRTAIRQVKMAFGEAKKLLESGAAPASCGL